MYTRIHSVCIYYTQGTHGKILLVEIDFASMRKHTSIQHTHKHILWIIHATFSPIPIQTNHRPVSNLLLVPFDPRLNQVDDNALPRSALAEWQDGNQAWLLGIFSSISHQGF